MKKKKRRLRAKKEEAAAPPAPEINEHHIHVNVMPTSTTHVEVPETKETAVVENSADRSLRDLRRIGTRGY